MRAVAVIILLFAATTAAANAERAVSATEFGDAWPLTVQSGRIACIAPSAAVFIHNGTIYQLNGMASSRGYTSINPIWRDSPDIPGAKVNIGPLISAALALC